ncbi:MAG: chloride channel protein [Actinomycetia bacterium]|nr:chloride channel protein [Actinomycetes bacterium]MCP4085483.1 chloride channel protein [Actinomycetes bacterium]
MTNRYPRVLVAAVAVGVLVGLVVAAFDWITVEILLHQLHERELWQIALAPAVGLALSAAALRWIGQGATPATSDEYVRAFHERQPRLPLRHLPGRLVAGMFTIGFGGAMGLEGPSIYTGATIGVGVRSRLQSFLSSDDAKLLMTAGAAAGVAAVFRTPATGVLFALEAPYRDDVARRALLPSLLAAASAYLVFVSLVGTEQALPLTGGLTAGLDDLGLSDLFGAVLVGLGAGLGGRSFAWLVRRAKALSKLVALPVRLVVAGCVLALLALGSAAAFNDHPLTIGPGGDAVAWVLDPTHEVTLQLIVLLFAMRLIATVVTVGGGGTGGYFIPLAVQGVIMGRFVGEVINDPGSRLWPTLGLAAFLGAGYRTPIAAVMFVAESTRGEGFVVPALIAAAVSQLVAGPSSVSEGQASLRLGHLERRFTLPITSTLTTDVLTVPPDATVAEFVWVHALGRRVSTVPVVDGETYLGMCSLDRASEIERDAWEDTEITAIMRTDLPVARPSWTLRDAVVGMESASTDVVAVTDSSGSFIGVVYEAEILKLDEILDETGG